MLWGGLRGPPKSLTNCIDLSATEAEATWRAASQTTSSPTSLTEFLPVVTSSVGASCICRGPSGGPMACHTVASHATRQELHTSRV